MANLNPFLSKPSEWVEKLAKLKDEQKRVEEAQDRLKEKILAYLKEKNLLSLVGDRHEVKLVSSETTDFSQKALAGLFGDDWLADTKAKLPKRVTESMRLVERKAEESAAPPPSSKVEEMNSFFGAADKPTKKRGR